MDNLAILFVSEIVGTAMLILLGGGVVANVKLNQRLKEIPGVEKVFIHPNMGDGGCGTGAAMLAFGHDKLPKGPFDNVYFGPDYSEAEIKKAQDEIIVLDQELQEE